MTTALDTLRCKGCSRILCRCHLPVGALVRVRCRDCKTETEFSAVPGVPVIRLTESIQYVATVARLTGGL